MNVLTFSMTAKSFYTAACISFLSMCIFHMIFQFNIFLMFNFFSRSIGGVTGRGIILSQLDSRTQGGKGGTYQSQKTLKRYGDLKRSMRRRARY